MSQPKPITRTIRQGRQVIIGRKTKRVKPKIKSELDISGEIGPINTPRTQTLFDREHQMYSYDRPAWLFWNGIAQYLEEEGYSREQILIVIKSRIVRYMLDRQQERVVQLGRACAETLRSEDINAIIEQAAKGVHGG